jgi:hypothetical protein
MKIFPAFQKSDTIMIRPSYFRASKHFALAM